jgi:hypothetical protein
MAMLYSLSAMTAYGHANIYLLQHWQFSGALEALNGMILFGLTTAFFSRSFSKSGRTSSKDIRREIMLKNRQPNPLLNFSSPD